MMTHYFVMTSSLRIKNFKIDKFGDFSSEIDFNTKMDIFRDVISLIINQYDPRRPKGTSGGYYVSVSRAAHGSEARLYVHMIIFNFQYPQRTLNLNIIIVAALGTAAYTYVVFKINCKSFVDF